MSTQSLLNQVVIVLMAISMFACVLIIVASVIKIMTGDEREKEIYTRRIKNALIALVCILLILTIKTVVENYFDSFSTGIGTFQTDDQGQIQDNLSSSSND